ncbi:MAG TPA: OsmC family protein [Dehalococcoidia bacterium]|nr:OsmC family protein [Dehalococcoidia bacterium]
MDLKAKSEALKRNQERTIAALRRKADLGRGTRTTVVSASGDLTCRIEDENWKFTADLDSSLGGEGAGPDPGTLGRAALGSCLAISYLLWAARLEIPVDNVEVVVESDFDVRGRLAVDPDLTPGWHRLRYTAYIDSSAPTEKLEELFRIADAHSPLLDDFVRSVPAEGKLVVGTRERGRTGEPVVVE